METAERRSIRRLLQPRAWRGYAPYKQVTSEYVTIVFCGIHLQLKRWRHRMARQT